MFEQHKIKREIVTNGDSYIVYRDIVDKYGEATGEKVVVTMISGLFHVSKGYVTDMIDDGTHTHGKEQPMLMILFMDSELIRSGDMILINGRQYKIVDINNIQECNVVCDLSLEVVLGGDKG